ncbi:MAG: amidase [Rhodoferax sp.]|nr:amidase [Rhodoferax sp.]
MNNLFQLSLSELANAMRGRQLSPVEVTRAFLDRIHRLDGQLKAYAEVWPDDAMAQARASEQRIMQGMPLGPLEGVPLGLKDLVHVEGKRTRAGSALYESRRPMESSATVSTRLLRAGAIPLGKTNLVELAFGGWGTNQGMATPRNPWDMRVARVPGGSSSGSAVAVAGGMAAGAIGTDTGGSVRIPAAFCGLTGLRPTFGRVSRHGVELLSSTLDTVGPITWTAEDAAMLMQVMHGPDPEDPTTLHMPLTDFIGGLRDPVRGTRYSVVRHEDLGTVDDAVVRRMEQACEVLDTLGCVRTNANNGRLDLSKDQEAAGVIIATEGYRQHGEALSMCEMPGDAASRARLMRGATIAQERYAEAITNRTQRMQAFQTTFADTDMLVLPTLPFAAPPFAEIDENDLSPSRLTRFVGYYGLTALALPCGFDDANLPVSVQLVAAPGQEALLLQVGAHFQRQTRHHLARPDL